MAIGITTNTVQTGGGTVSAGTNITGFSAAVVYDRGVEETPKPRVLSAKFLLNLCIGASVLHFTSYLLKIGYDLKMIFTLASFIAIGVLVSSVILPSQGKQLNPNI